jgi:hypothetical protein
LQYDTAASRSSTEMNFRILADLRPRSIRFRVRHSRLGEGRLHDFVALAPKMGPQDMGKPAGVASLQRIQDHFVLAYRFSPNASLNGPANKRK